MSPLIVDFKQLTDLAVDTASGRVNTDLLHKLIYVIVDQLHLSSDFVEINDELVGNSVVKASTTIVKEYEVIDEVNEASGEVIKVRKESAQLEASQTVKLFTVRADECALGSRSISCQGGPNSKSRRMSNAYNRMKAVNERVVKLADTETALKPTFDLINVTKRIEALEIGTRQLADIMKQFKCDCDRISSAQSEQRREIDFLMRSHDSLLAELRELKDSRSDGEAEEMANRMTKLDGTVNELSSEICKKLEESALLKSEIDELKLSLDEKFVTVEVNAKSFEKPLCERLSSLQEDLTRALREIQEMLDAKLDKCSVGGLKQFIQSSISDLEEKIAKVDCPKSLAAGTFIKIYKDLNCISCGEGVIQEADTSIQQKLMTDRDYDWKLETRASNRNCGGVHTITLPGEKVFRGEKF